MKELLEKVRGLVPFVWDGSKVEFGGETKLRDKEPFVERYTWQEGWREEGKLLLDAFGEITGKVIRVYSSGVRGVEPREEVEKHDNGEPYYVLRYEVKFDTEESEWAALYRIEK